MGRQCPICGKLLKSGSEDAMRSHQRESQSCYPTSGKGESNAIKALDEKLRSLIDEGRRLGTTGGSFEETQRNEAERQKVEHELKNARKEHRNEKQAVKDLAKASMSAANWTQVLLAGDQRFSKGEESVEGRLAQQTVGLVTSSEFREIRASLEAEAVFKEMEALAQEKRERAAAEEEKKARRKKQRQEQASKLSFEDEDG